MKIESDTTESPLPITELIDALASSELDCDETKSMDAPLFWYICKSSNHHTSQCEQLQDLEALIHAQNQTLMNGVLIKARAMESIHLMKAAEVIGSTNLELGVVKMA